jgi:hypothetical protein
MKADILTKIMPGPTFVRLSSLIGINAPIHHEGTWGMLDETF